jgi:Helix-turn-helix domain
MVLKPRPVDLTEVEPHNIRHASHRGTAADLRVIVREHEASEGGMDLPGGTSHFWLEFRPAEAPERMLVTFKDTQERCFVDRSLRFFAPGQRHAVEWRGGRGPVVQFLLAPAFLLEVTVSLRLNAGALAWRPWQKVALEEPLETLCRLLMREVVIASEGHRRSLAEIALAAGFADQAHLTRHFQRVFGQAPGHWREQNAKG